MKKLTWVSLIVILILLSGLTLAAKPVLRVGSDATYEPFESIDNGKYVGFDMEFIQMVADTMGYQLKVQNIAWDGIIPGLMNGNYDCLISAMTITDERKKQINFSTPYFSIRQCIVVKQNITAVKGPNDLIGKAISVQNGTTGDITLASKIKDAKVKRFDTNAQAIQELLNNGVYAAVMDDLVGFHAAKKFKGIKVIELKDAAKEDYGIGVKKGNDALLKKINAAIDTLKKNGKLDKLILKYKGGK